MDETLTTLKLDEATTRFDNNFQRIQGLTWLPWVGQNFPERLQDKRLLVVGESHYYKGETPEKLQANRESYKDPKSTRDIVSEQLVNCCWEGGNKTLDAIPKLLFKTKTQEIDRPRLWADSAYYNFVQRPMNHNVEEQPTSGDFVLGWKVLAEVIGIIQPSHCLFIGVTSANHFNLGNITRHEKVGGVWPRVAKIEIAGTTTELIFVHHLGRCKNVALWHDYLQNHHTSFTGWLGAESYPISQMLKV